MDVHFWVYGVRLLGLLQGLEASELALRAVELRSVLGELAQILRVRSFTL